jgi:hypothetical protein
MVRRPGDKTPEPPGGRAAERLRMFEQARRPDRSHDLLQAKPSKRKPRSKKSEGEHEK